MIVSKCCDKHKYTFTKRVEQFYNIISPTSVAGCYHCFIIRFLEFYNGKIDKIEFENRPITDVQFENLQNGLDRDFPKYIHRVNREQFPDKIKIIITREWIDQKATETERDQRLIKRKKRIK